MGISVENEYQSEDPLERAKLEWDDFPLNTFLITEKSYSDFIIELELKVGDMNGGIQFRSNSEPEFFNGIFHGYQCEVDPSERAWSAGIYEEMGQAWLYPVTYHPEACTAFKLNEWNLYRIECIGNNIRTWLNGIPVTHLVDGRHSEGHFGLQVHFTYNLGQVGERIYWRNIRIKTKDLTPAPSVNMFIANYIPNNLSEAEAEQGWKLIFDRESAAGLKNSGLDKFPVDGWVVGDGMIRSAAAGEELSTTNQHEAFDLQLEFKTREEGEGGITYLAGTNTPGLEYLILHNDSTLDSDRTASARGLIQAKQVFMHPGTATPSPWNRGRIVSYPNGKVEHWLNGEKVFDYIRGSDEFTTMVSQSKYADDENFEKFKKAPIKFMVREGSISFRSI